MDGELHPDRVALVVLILDLGLGQRRALHHRPQHRFRPLEQGTVHQELAEFTDDRRFSGKAHRRVGMVPVADDAEPLELLTLHVDPAAGKLAAFLTELIDRHLVLVATGGAILLLDLPLNRQAVTVPAGNVIGILAQHLLRPVDHVLEDLVQRVTDVQMAVGVGRTVVENELRQAARGITLTVVEVHRLPPTEQVGLAPRQIRLHREVGARKNYGCFIVHVPIIHVRLAFGIGCGGRSRAADAEPRRGIP